MSGTTRHMHKSYIICRATSVRLARARTIRHAFQCEVWKLNLNNIKALVVVLLIATTIFHLARPVCLRFMKEGDFATRRTAWFILTIAAFLSPNFWLYVLVAAPVSIWAGRRDSNPAALYLLLLFAAPAVSVHVPKIIDLSQSRLLGLCVLIPALLRSPLPACDAGIVRNRSGVADFLLFSFCTIQALAFLPYESESWTSVLRREITLLLDIMLPYLAFSRTIRSFRSIPDAMAVFLLACVVVAPLAVFESLRGWQLYAELANSWGVGVNRFGYLMRGSQLRAMATTGHSLALGLILAVGFGFSLYLMRTWKAGRIAAGTWFLLWAGLLSAYSRAGWITALLLMFVYLWLLPGGASRVVKTASLMMLGAMAAAFTPFGKRIIDSLPFIGKMDAGSVDYRQQLFQESLRFIPLHPWFGDLTIRSKMTSLIQGQGIVDLVNGYLNIALQYGLVTLATVVLFLLIVVGKTRIASKRAQDADVAQVGSNLVACMLATFFFIWAAGFPEQLWMLAGLGVAYARLLYPRSRQGA